MPHEPTPPDGADRCVSEEEAIGFVGRGAANEATIAGTLAHIEGCARCRRLVGEAARLRGDSAPGVRATSVAVGERLGGRYEILARVTAEGTPPFDEVTFDALDHQQEVVVTVRTFGLGLMPGSSGRDPGRGGQADNELAGLAAAAETVVRALRAHQHPNLRRSLDAGVHLRTGASTSRSGRAMGIPWVAVELIEGEGLDEHVARVGPLATEAALPLVSGVVAALTALHGVRETAPYAGFTARGIVLATGERQAPRVVLDPLAPERLTAAPADEARARDLRALGALMFHLVAGRPLHADETPAPGSPWDDVIGRCLSPRGLRRFRSADDVLRALQGGRLGWAARWLTAGRAR